MEEKDQQEFLIQQLKDLLRANEERLQQKERELEENNAKFQKFKLQSKAKLQQLTSKVKAQDAQAAEGGLSPDAETTSEDASSSSRPPGSLEPSSRGRMLILKRQLEETRLQYQKKEQELENSRKSLESMVEQLQSQLLQRDQVIMNLGAGGDSLQHSVVPSKKQELTPQEENKLYAQMVYKDSKILELNNQITELEGKIMDLQENLKEKDEVLQARNKAIQLMTGDLSLRNKTAVDDLDDTRAEMRNMQQEFLTRESSWKEQEAHLQEQMAVAETRLRETQDALQKLEATRFDLAARNAELQQKVVMAQEAFEKRSVESEKALQGKLDFMSKQLEEKNAELEAVQSALKETVSQSDAKILKARAIERRRAKTLEGELEQLKKGLSNNEELTSLQQQVAELEEEKGAIQLKMLEMEEALSAQASKLEGMEEKESAIAELESQVKAAQDEKISLEMRAAEFEEQRELAERRMQSIQQELEALKNTSEPSVPHLETEIKMALEEEVKNLNAQHKHDELIISELKEKLDQQEAANKELEQNMKDLKTDHDAMGESLQDAQKQIKEKEKELGEIVQSVSDLSKALADEQHEKDTLHAAFVLKEKEIQKVLEDLNLSSIQEISVTVRSMTTYKAQCEELNEAVKAKMAENDELNSKLTELHKTKQDLNNMRSQVEDIENCFQYLSVSSADEVKAKWNSLRDEIASLNRSFEAEREKLNATLAEQSGEIKSLLAAMAQKDDTVQRLSNELNVWQSEGQLKDQQLSEMKICLDKAEKEVDFLKESSSSEGRKVESKIASLLEQSADLEREVARLQEVLEMKSRTLEDLEQQLRCSTAEAENLKQEMQKLETDCKLKEAAMKQDLDRFVFEQETSKQVMDTYKSTVTELEKKVAIANEELAKTMSSSEKQIRKLEEQVMRTHADLEAKCTENQNLMSLLAKSDEEQKIALEKLDMLSAELKELRESEKHLEEKLDAAETAYRQAMSQLQAEAEKADRVVEQLEDTAKARLDLENECAQLKATLTGMKNEATQASHERHHLEQSLSEMSRNREKLSDANNELSKQIESLQLQLHALEAKSTTAIAELEENIEALSNKKRVLEDRCNILEGERGKQSTEMQELSTNYSDAVAKVEVMSKQNEQLKAKLRKAAKELTHVRSKLQEVEMTSNAQHTELTSVVENLEVQKHTLESTCAHLENEVSEKQDNIDRLTNSLYEMENNSEAMNAENLELKQRISHLLQEHDSLKQQSHNAFTANSSKIQELNDNIELLQAEKTDLEKHYIALQAANKELSQQVTVTQQSMQETCLENEQLRQQHSELLSGTAHAREELLEANKAVEDMQHAKIKAEDKCAELGQVIAEKQKQIDESLRDIGDMSDKLIVERAENKRHQEEKEQLLSQLSALQSVQSKTEAKLQELQRDKENLLVSETKLQELLKAKNNEFSELQVMLGSREAELNALKDNAETEQSHLLIKVSEQAQVIEQKSGELELVKSELSLCKNTLTAVQGDLTWHTEKLQAAEQANSELMKEMGILRIRTEETLEAVALKDDSLQKMSEQREILKNSIEELVLERLDLQQKLQKMAELEEQCNSRSHALAELSRQVKEKSATNEQLLTDLDEAKKELRHLATLSENRVKELEEQVEGYKQREKKLHDSEHALQDELALLKEQKQEVDKIMDEMNKQCHVTAKELQVSLEQTATLQSELEKAKEEFLDTKHKLEEEVSSYAAKVGAQDEYSRTLEAQLESLKNEKQHLDSTLKKASDEMNSYREDSAEAIALRDRTLAEHEEERQKLKDECQSRVQELEMECQAKVTHAKSQLQNLEVVVSEMKEHCSSLEQQLFVASSAKNAKEQLQNDLAAMNEAYNNLQEQVRCQSQEIEHLKEEQASKEESHAIIPHPNPKIEVQEEGIPKAILHEVGSYTDNVVIAASQSELTSICQGSEDLPATLQLAHETIQQQSSKISDLEHKLKELGKALFKARKGTQEQRSHEGLGTEGNYKEEESFQASAHQESTKEATADDVTEQQTLKTQKMEAELQKLKLAFKKSRGELRLKARILEERTRELQELKEQNTTLQSDFQTTVEALAEEKCKAKQLVYACGEQKKEIEALKGAIQNMTTECQTAQAELCAASKALAAKESQYCDVQSRLVSSSTELEAALQCIQQREHEKEEIAAEYSSVMQEVEHLRSELQQMNVAAEVAAMQSTDLLSRKSEEANELRSVMEHNKYELEKLSAEYSSLLSAQSKQEESVHGELETLNTDIQRLNTENAEMMRVKAEEVDALQEQLQFLKDDLMKYIDIADEKSQEVDALQEKLESSQESLDKLQGEFGVLRELLLHGIAGSDEELRKEVDECGVAQAVKKLVSREKANVEMLKSLLDKQTQELSATQQEVLRLQEDIQVKDADLMQCLYTLQTLLQKTSSEVPIEHSFGRTINEDVTSVLDHIVAEIRCLHEENHRALQDATHFRTLTETLRSEMESLSLENANLRTERSSSKELGDTTLQGVPENKNVKDKIDMFCQTDHTEEHDAPEKGQVELTQEKEQLQSQVLLLQAELTELQTKRAATEAQQSSEASRTPQSEIEEIKKDLSATKVKSGRMLTKLKMFKEKTEKMEGEMKRLYESNKELEERWAQHEEWQREDAEKRTALEERCKALQEQVACRVPQHDYDVVSADLVRASARLQEFEMEKEDLSDRIQNLSDRNGQLEVEASHLVSQFSVLKEQADMLTSDNESFQSLVETLTHSRQALEHELRSQQEQHTKVVKELENKLSRSTDELKAADTELASLTSKYESLQQKHNEIVYKYRSLEEQFHFATEEKNQLKVKCEQLESECASLQETAAFLKKQASATEQESMEFVGSLKQEHEELKQQFHRLKAEHHKTEERLVSAAAYEQQSTVLRTQLEDAKAVISSLKESSEENVHEIINLRRETDELKKSLALSLEEFDAKEKKWMQERNQLKHIGEHLKEAAETLSGELEELKIQHEEALHSKLQLRSEIEETQKEKKALAQQVQNWRSYIKDIENNKSLGSENQGSEMTRLELELQHTAKTLHQIGLQNETLIADLNKALEEKKHLQHQLADTQRNLQAREDQILQLHTNIASSSDSYIINMGPAAQPQLDQKLFELQQANEVLLSNWKQEQQRRRLIEEELDSSILRKSRTPLYTAPSEQHHLLLREGIVKIPETNYSITRQFKSHAYKLRRWFQGRQSTSTSSVHHI